MDHSQPRDYNGKPEELRRDLFAHIEELTRFVGGRVAEWDAVNHPIGWGPRTYADECGARIYADVIRRGRELAPKTEMWINEENTSSSDKRTLAKYLALTQELIRLDAKPDGVGFMGHYKGTLLPSPEAEVNGLADEFGRLGVKLQFTEFDVSCGADEEMQADFLRDMLTMTFSRAEFTSFVNWGFWEGRHWIPNAALWRRDWTMKPAAKVWEEMVLRQWQTRASCPTGKDGSFVTRGFLGEYTVKVSVGDKTATATTTLTREGGMATLKLP
jgi:GH35 family endo-1,4-beta-xylanase